MAVPTAITDLSVTVASNSPAGADTVTVGAGPDNYFQALSAIIRREQAQGAAVASAATVDLGAIADGNYVHITGTTTITAFGTVAAGIERTVVFDGALTLTHNATSLILPGGANITTAAGDVGRFRSEGSGNWRCVVYMPATGYQAAGSYQPLDTQLTTLAAITAQQATDLASISTFIGTLMNDADAATARTTLGVGAASSTAAGIVELATSAEVATGTDTARAITPAGLAASKIVAGTAIATTSGTAHDFTSVPSWVKRITLMLDGVSTSGTSELLVQLGDSGGIEATGYVSGSLGGTNTSTSTIGFVMRQVVATDTCQGAMYLHKLDGNTWTETHGLYRTGSAVLVNGGGGKTLTGTLTQIRLTTVGGTDTFDAGSINILYE